MFDLDKWQEILGTMRRNKLRTFLTAFGVFWGIFMLVLLLGAGKGMENGVWKEFGSRGQEQPVCERGQNVAALAGPAAGPRNQVHQRRYGSHPPPTMEGVELLASRNRLFGEYTIINGTKNGSYQVFGANAEFFQISGEQLASGRLLNPLDGIEQRKVMLLGEKVRKVLFGDSSGIGQYVQVKGVFFRVVGTFTNTGNNGRNEERAFVPFSYVSNHVQPIQPGAAHRSSAAARARPWRCSKNRCGSCWPAATSSTPPTSRRWSSTTTRKKWRASRGCFAASGSS